ncbi:MAG: translation initiation factor [Planctomycetes bacterium]|nr:translation initiation factor [Planctomycetota bacterium]
MSKQLHEGDGWRFGRARKETRRLDTISRAPGEQRVNTSLEKPGRGKIVTCIGVFALSRNDLAALASDLKSACGTGGTARDGFVRLQGDCRERARAWLVERGYGVQ